jgi:hypothetical protein
MTPVDTHARRSQHTVGIRNEYLRIKFKFIIKISLLILSIVDFSIILFEFYCYNFMKIVKITLYLSKNIIILERLCPNIA